MCLPMPLSLAARRESSAMWKERLHCSGNMHDNPKHVAAVSAPPVPKWKRIVDIMTSAFALALLSPVFLLIALVIKMSSSGPAILRQQRIGRSGKAFTLWKFRTMHLGVDEGIHQDHLNTLIEMDVP